VKSSTHLYRKRGALVEAMRLTGTPPDGTNVEDVFTWMRESMEFPEKVLTAGDDLVIVIPGEHLGQEARVGDWIIKYRNREFGVISDDVFEDLYEVVE